MVGKETRSGFSFYPPPKILLAGKIFVVLRKGEF